MLGPPGIGKSMLARCMPGLLPELSEHEALDVRQVLSVCGQHELAAAPHVARPFRAPHHTITIPALVGGGRPVVPGEITRAIHGVLFLDEIAEFSRGLLDLMRQPLEEGSVSLSRANSQLQFPARFQLLAAMNPCPCGNQTHPRKSCRCTPGEVQRYRNRISGPILDRIDLVVSLGVPTEDELRRTPEVDTKLPLRIAAARVRQARRFEGVDGVYCNAQAGSEERNRLIRLRPEARSFLRRALTRWDLSVRAHERTLAVARSIADLDGASDVDVQHVAEALQYRVDSGTA
jgi:magnesium chelatase family protein